jgi:tRNA(Ile2) C34 agmatinyltransferase TiaS
MMLTLQKIWCALRGHGGVTWVVRGEQIDWRCKRCGREWREVPHA